MARFINRFGKRQTIYAKTLNELRTKLREEQYKDEKEINVVTKDVTLDGWYNGWIRVNKVVGILQKRRMQSIISEFSQI